jgi:hypothetical protein
VIRAGQIDADGVTEGYVLTANGDVAGWAEPPEGGVGGGGGVTENLALRKPYTLTAPNGGYPDYLSSGLSPLYAIGSNGDYDTSRSAWGKLTDGIKNLVTSNGGVWQYTSGFWVGWNTSPVEVRLDLLTAAAGDTLAIHGFYIVSGGPQRPTAIHVESSDDDSSWSTVQNLTGLTAAPSGEGFWRMDVDISAGGSHRYWRATFTHGAWLFLDEIEFLVEP